VRASSRLDVLLLGLTGVWCVVFVFHLDSVASGRLAWLPIAVDRADSASGLPVVRELWHATHNDGALQRGDEIVAVGEKSMIGTTPLDFVGAVFAEDTGALPLTTRRGENLRTLELQLPPVLLPLRKSVVSASFAVLAALALWRTRGTGEGRLFFLAMTAYAFHWADFWGGSPARTLAGISVFGASICFFMPLALRAAMSFPPEAAREGWSSRAWPWLLLPVGLITTSWAFGLPGPLPEAERLALGMNGLFILLLVGILSRNYRVSGLAGRRQLRWVVFGFWIGLVPAFVASNIALLVPTLSWLYELCLAFAVFIPVCLFIALVRYQLYDVDRLLTAAATYTLVGIVAIGGVFFLAPKASAATAEWIDPNVGQSVFSLAFGGLVFVGLRRIDRAIQQRLYPERRALLEDSRLLRRDLSDCEKPIDILIVLGRRLRSLLRLETVAVYSRARTAYAPVYARGPGVCPAFDPDGTLVEHLAMAGAAVETKELAGPAFAEADVEALHSMGVELVLPVRSAGGVSAFVCLGGKRSGDVFTGPDRALLQGLADKAGDELERFSLAEIQRESRERAERMRSFVPGAVARELDAGLVLEAGEREISVLFADIRGYTPFSEGQEPAAIFAAVSEYTQLVSQIVEAHGGAVVEFHGDGLMAVFGAPRPLDDKERRATEAAQEIAVEVPRLELRGADGAPVQLDVGVGIASGSGYVGPLQAIDRAIWVALGNTTNLAARLEGATRTLDVAIVIDAATHHAIDESGDAFSRVSNHRVKGRRLPMDVYTWSPITPEEK